ncbi:MAG: glycosyltransferase family 4 protein [Bacteroidetes bacterium]|nr:glycosyltransferase family 4 protein [Bacteroidota bacterium]
MRILFLAESINICNGAAKHLLLLSKHLIKRGDEVLILTGLNDAPELNFDVQIIECENLLHAKRSFWKFLKGIYFIAKIKYNFKPDIVHAHHFYCAQQAKLITKKNKFVFTVHGIIPATGYLPHLVGKNIIAGTSEVNKYILSKSIIINNPNIFRINFATSFERIYTNVKLKNHKAPSFKLRDDIFTIGFIGRINKIKGIHVIIDSLKKLKSNRKINFIFAGSGPLENVIPKKINKISISIFKNVVEIENIYKMCDLILIPSLGHEGLPLVLLESGLLKKCVIASNVDGIKDVIVDKFNGLLISPNNSNKLSNSIKAVILEDKSRIKFGNNLYKTIQKYHNLKIMIDKTENLYKSLI